MLHKHSFLHEQPEVAMTHEWIWIHLACAQPSASPVPLHLQFFPTMKTENFTTAPIHEVHFSIRTGKLTAQNYK